MLMTIFDLRPRELVRTTIARMEENHLLTYLSACAFLIGAQVDALVRHGETGSHSGS
jgi:hypothetical protein